MNRLRLELSTGRVVVLVETWGWEQPAEQFERLGPVSQAEAAEAWEIVDARKAEREHTEALLAEALRTTGKSPKHVFDTSGT